MSVETYTKPDKLSVEEEEAFDWSKIFNYLNILRKRWLIIIQVLSIILLVTYIQAKREVPLYQAASQVIVLPKAQIIQRGDSYIYTPQFSMEARLQMMQGPEIGEEIAKRLKEEQNINISPGEASISIAPKDETEMLMVTAINRDPKLAQLIANYGADVFVERDHEFDSVKMKKTREIIEEQLAIVDKALREAEGNLYEFQNKEGILDMNTEMSETVKWLSELRSEQTMAEVETQVSQAKMKIANKELSADVNIDEKDAFVENLEAQLAQYEIELAGMKQKWAEGHPEILATKAKIEATQSKLSEAIAAQNARATNKNEMLLQNTMDIEEAKMKKEVMGDLIVEQNDYLFTLPAKVAKMKELLRQVSFAESKYQILETKLQELKIEEATMQGNMEVLSYAGLPGGPCNINLMSKMKKAGMVGLFLGILLALLIELLNMPLTNEEDIKKRLNLPVLEVIPKIKFKKGESAIAFGDGKSKKATHLTEAFRSLRTVINFSTRDEQVKTILVTSSIPSEGKTTIASNLAISYANMGKNVLLIEADLLRPGLSDTFETTKKKGLGDYLTNDVITLDSIIYDTKVPNLKFLPAGKRVKSTSELLESQRMRDFMRELKENKDIDLILFDTPPCQPVTDGIIMASMVDKVVMVVNYNMNARTAQRSLKLLQNAQADIIGVVINKMDTGSGSYYYYKYKYGYYYDSDGRRKRKNDNNNRKKDVKDVGELVFKDNDREVNV